MEYHVPPRQTVAMPRTPWPCADRQCQSDQHHEPREKKGRKVISDFFGRNKRETKRIPEEVWHFGCRKLYQRGVYDAKKDEGSPRLCNHFLGLLTEQVIRIQIWRPQAVFKVQLQGPAKARLQQYHSILSRNGGDEDGAKRQVIVTPKMRSKGEPLELTNVEAVEMHHAEHIDTQLAGTAKRIDYLLGTVLVWIESEVKAGRMTRMPPIEFLIDEAQPSEAITDPFTNYDRWTAQQDGIEYKSPEVESNSSSKRRINTSKASSSRPPINSRPPPRIKLPSTRIQKAALETPKAASSSIGITDPQIRLSISPPSFPIANEGKGKGKQRASLPDSLSLYFPPASITSKESKGSPADDLPLYVLPSPVAPSPRSITSSSPSGKKRRPSPIVTALANAKQPTYTDQASSNGSSLTEFESDNEHEHEQPQSADTEIEVTPIEARGMVSVGGKRKRVLREAEETSSTNAGMMTLESLRTDKGLRTVESDQPGSAYTEVDDSPIRARGMVFADAKR
ncbi:hypothetical protein DOTSEDRAFT_52097 [Dothistroma septosporum NZE10]|uniref:Uncharacterized protein n=1 Tax=Dothistroma septosporum (strain NZE10 / CBS 128990) TaxID=675120 RepID=N1PWU3_DOTSN|nr:hypothetical protein DOTSEDRAFT_52097 [Dothistroma septosporum NZE10]